MKVRLLQKAHKKKTNVFLNLSLIIYTTSSDSSSTFCDAVHSRQIFDYFKVNTEVDFIPLVWESH